MNKTIIIAEAGVNHNGDIRIAKQLVDAAAKIEEHTSELQSRINLVCRLLLEKKK